MVNSHGNAHRENIKLAELFDMLPHEKIILKRFEAVRWSNEYSRSGSNRRSNRTKLARKPIPFRFGSCCKLF